MGYKEHGVLIYLSNQLYVGFVKLQADKGLGRSYAALLPFVEGLYNMGYISKDVYEAHKARYSQPLIKEKELVSIADQKRATEMNKVLGQVLAQWPDHTDEAWRQKWIDKAQENSELSNAQLILKQVKANGV